MLRRVGLKVKTIYQVYPRKKHEGIKDPQWIAKCGKEGWVAISGDKRIERNIENKQAVIDAKCKLFLLSDTNSLPEEWAAAIIVGREKMSSVIRKNAGPFLATIKKRSDSHVTNARFPSAGGDTAGAEVIVEVLLAPKKKAAASDSIIKLESEKEPRLFKDDPEENHQLQADPAHPAPVQASDSGRAQGETAREVRTDAESEKD